MKVTVSTMDGQTHEYNKTAKYDYAPGDRLLLMKLADGKMVHHPVVNILRVVVEEDGLPEEVPF